MVLQKARDQMAGGRLREAGRTIEELLRRKGVTDATWEQAIRAELEGGLLDEAASNAEKLIRRSGHTPPKAAQQKMLEEVLTAHVKEMDRILAMKTWADVGVEEDSFSTRVPKILRRAVRVDRPKAEAVLKHAYVLLQQSPAERNLVEAGRLDGPSSHLLGQMGGVPGMMGLVLAQADEAGLSRTQGWYELYVGQMRGDEGIRDATHALAMFRGTPIVAEAGEFRDVVMPRSSWKTLLGDITSWFRWDEYSDLKKVVLDDLASRKSRTFGVELVECLIADGDDNHLLRAFLKRRRADLGKLSDEGASTMLALLSTRFYAITSPAPLDPELAEAITPLMEAETWHLDSVRFTWQKAKGFEELKLDGESAVAIGQQVLERLLVRDARSAQVFLEQTVKLFRTAAGDEKGQLAKDFLQAAAGVPELLGPVLKVAGREGFTQEGDWLSATLSRAWRPGDHVDQPQRLITFLEAAGVLGDARAFTAAWRTDEPHDKGFMKRILSTFSGRPSTARVFLPVLAARQPRTFGADVLDALLKPGSDKALIEVARLYPTELEALPSDRQAELGRFFSLWVKDLDALARAVPGLAAGLRLHQSEKAESAQSLVDRILNAAQMKELFEGASPHDMEMRSGTGLPSGRSGAAMTRAAEAIAAVHAKDPKRAGEAFQKLTQLVESGDSMSLPATMRLQSGSVGAWLLVAADYPQLLPWVVQTATRISANPEFIWMQRVEERMFPVAGFLDPKVAVRLLEKYQLLVQVEQFSPLVFAPGRHQVEMVVRRIRALSPEARAAFAVELQKRQPATFGADFFASLCQNDLQKAAGVLNARSADIERADGGRKQMLLLSLNSVFPGLLKEKFEMPREGALGLLLKHEDELELKYLEAFRTRTAPGSMLQPLRGVSSVTGRELRRLLDAGDRAAAESFFETAVTSGSSPSRAEPHRMAVFVLNPVLASTRVQTLLRDGRARMAGFVWQRLQADTTGQLGVPGPAMALLAADGLHDSWLDAGGWADAAGAARSMLAEFASGLKDAPPVAVAPVLSSFLKLVPEPSRKEILAWALADPGTGPEGALIRELAAAGAFQEALQKGDKAGMERGWAHYAGKLADAPRLQLGLSIYWCQQAAPAQAPSSLVLPATRTAVECWKRGYYLPVAEFAVMFESFATTPDDAGWEAVAKEFAGEWKTHARNAAKGRITSIQPDSVHATFGILARLGDTEALDLCEQANKSPYAQESWPAAVLAARGQPARAAALLSAGWSRIAAFSLQPVREVPASPLPDKDIVAAFAKAFQPEQSDLALLGEYALLQDSRPRRRDGQDAAALKQWENLMADFVDRVARTPVQDASVRRSLYALILRTSPRQLPRLATLIAGQAELAVPGLEKYQPNTAEAWPVEVLALHAAARLLEGAETSVVSKDLQHINDMLRGSSASSSASSRSLASMYYLMRLVETLAPAWPDLSSERRNAVMSTVGESLPTSSSAISSTELESLRWLVDTWRAASGQPPLQTAAKPSTGRFATPTLTRLKELVTQMGAEGKSRLPLDFRLKWTIEVLNRPEMQVEFSQPSSPLPVVLASLSLLSAEEAVASAGQLVDGLSQGGRTSYDLAAMAFATAGAQKAVEIMELAGREAPPRVGTAANPAMPPGEALLLRKAALLIKAGRSQEALTLLNGVSDASSVPGKKGLVNLATMAPTAAP